MHPGRSSAKHRRAGKVRQSDARHTRKGQRGGVGVGEGGDGGVGEVVVRVVGHFITVAIPNLLVGRRDVNLAFRAVSCLDRNLIDRLIELVMRIGLTFFLLAHIVREGFGTIFKVLELICLRLEIDRSHITVFVSGIREINCCRFWFFEVRVVLVREFE